MKTAARATASGPGDGIWSGPHTGKTTMRQKKRRSKGPGCVKRARDPSGNTRFLIREEYKAQKIATTQKENCERFGQSGRDAAFIAVQESRKPYWPSEWLEKTARSTHKESLLTRANSSSSEGNQGPHPSRADSAGSGTLLGSYSGLLPTYRPVLMRRMKERPLLLRRRLFAFAVQTVDVFLRFVRLSSWRR